MKIVFGGAKNEMSAERLAVWRDEFPGVEFVAVTNNGEQQQAASGADAWIGRITREAFVAAGPQLKWVHSTGAGIEKLTAIPELIASDVVVTNTRGSHATAVAEHTFALMLALTRQLPLIVHNQAAHTYRNPGIAGGLRELGGATMGIVGFGKLGQAIAKRAVAFEMRVIGIDLFPGAAPDGVEAVVGLDQLDTVLPKCDVVVIALPLTAETRYLIDARRINSLKHGAMVIAISRGGIVDEQALAAALQSGHLAGAALDVQATEPLPVEDSLWDIPNLIISPHCSSTSRQTTERVWASTKDNVRRFVDGTPLENVCDKQAGF